jgi:5'-nucleotidase
MLPGLAIRYPTMTPPPFILLTNDDGIDSPGLAALHDAVAPLGRVEIVAPTIERSAASHAVSIRKDLSYRRVERDGAPWGHALDGTPADCVKLGLTGLFDRRPDIVLSGINPGANLGNNILYSGTVSAAREAAMYGVPAIAVSVQKRPQPPGGELHFETAARFVVRLIPQVLEHGLPKGVLLNVNVPNLPPEEIAGVVASRQGRTTFIDEMQPQSLNGTTHAFSNIGTVILRSEPEELDCDDVVLTRKMISVSPLGFDLTHEGTRREIAAWFAGNDARGGLDA